MIGNAIGRVRSTQEPTLRFTQRSTACLALQVALLNEVIPQTNETEEKFKKLTVKLF